MSTPTPTRLAGAHEPICPKHAHPMEPSCLCERIDYLEMAAATRVKIIRPTTLLALPRVMVFNPLTGRSGITFGGA